MSKGGKIGKCSYFLTFQFLSPRLTRHMMISVQLDVDEIVTTLDSIGSLFYAFIHFPRRVTEQELAKALNTLETTHGVKGSNIFGYDMISSSSINTSELIEDHPGFRTLVAHEEQGNDQFNRWIADGYPGANCGYNLLKNKLLTKRTSGPAASGGAGGFGTGNDEEEQHPRPSESDGERTKRRRTASPDGGGQNMISPDLMKAVISSTISATGSAVASAIHSSGQAQMEQHRVAEKKLQEAEMKYVAENAQRAADLVGHNAQLKAKDERLSEQQGQVSELKLDAEAKDKEIAGLREDMEKTSDSKDLQIAALKEEIAKAKQTSDSKDEEITTLSEKYNTLKDECFQTSKDYDKKTTELKAFSCARLQDMQQRCDKLQETSLAKDGEIATLHDQMALLKDECHARLQNKERENEEFEEQTEEELMMRRKNMVRMLEGLEEAHTKEVGRLRLKVSTAEKKLQNMEAARATQSAETEKLQVGIRFFIDVNKLTMPHLPGASLSRPGGNGAQRERDQDSRA